MSQVMTSMKKKVGFGRVGAPVWAVALTLAATAAVAGQALGPVLAGGGSGDVGVVASQSLFFENPAATAGHSGSDGIDQAAANIDTAGLVLNGAFRMHRGDDASTPAVDVTNRGNNTKRSAQLTLVPPVGSSVNITESDADCQLAQASLSVTQGGVQTDKYLLVVNAAATCTLGGSVKVGSAEPLGSYAISLTTQEIP